MLKKVKICQLISKKSQHPDRKGGGVNPYGQPDRKMVIFENPVAALTPHDIIVIIILIIIIIVLIIIIFGRFFLLKTGFVRRARVTL